ncbi:radical SAM protein [Streptomyces sp. NPDC087851]|uniref:radical SAM protein n=1 Tax=Streptomyces sp. NPDC087851 TaxID=3365810 RepID=UPI0037F4B106
MTTRPALPQPETDLARTSLNFAWLEVTGFCDLECAHCYADSSPQGTHGTMTAADWKDCIGQLAEMGTRNVQFIGGEPALYPHLTELIAHPQGAGVSVEVFSNLTHISDELWAAFVEYGVKLATSYYSDEADDHDKVTGRRGAHARTRANIQRARELKIPLRGGVISVHQGQRTEEAVHDLSSLGLTVVGGDHTRRFGRGSNGVQPTVGDLCGHCAHGKCAIGPDGDVWPCVLGRFISLGNVRHASLDEIWNGVPTTNARQEIEAAHGPDGASVEACTPPQFLPMCGPCSPCVPSVGNCDPRPSGAATIGVPGQIGS